MCGFKENNSQSQQPAAGSVQPTTTRAAAAAANAPTSQFGFYSNVSSSQLALQPAPAIPAANSTPHVRSYTCG